jgi:tetratricopeptide (TPR) repeat protein
MAKKSDSREIKISPKLEKMAEDYGKNPKSRNFVNLAEEYRRSHMYEEAIIVCEEGLRHHPNFFRAKLLSARCQYELGNNSDALLIAAPLENEQPDSIPLLRLLADISRSLEHFDESEYYLKKILDVQPDNEAAQMMLEKNAAAKSSFAPDQTEEDSADDETLEEEEQAEISISDYTPDEGDLMVAGRQKEISSEEENSSSYEEELLLEEQTDDQADAEEIEISTFELDIDEDEQEETPLDESSEPADESEEPIFIDADQVEEEPESMELDISEPEVLEIESIEPVEESVISEEDADFNPEEFLISPAEDDTETAAEEMVVESFELNPPSEQESDSEVLLETEDLEEVIEINQPEEVQLEASTSDFTVSEEVDDVVEEDAVEDSFNDLLATDEPVADPESAEDSFETVLEADEPVLELDAIDDSNDEIIEIDDSAADPEPAEDSFVEIVEVDEPVIEVDEDEDSFNDLLATDEPVADPASAEGSFEGILEVDEPVIEVVADEDSDDEIIEIDDSADSGVSSLDLSDDSVVDSESSIEIDTSADDSAEAVDADLLVDAALSSEETISYDQEEKEESRPEQPVESTKLQVLELTDPRVTPDEVASRGIELSEGQIITRGVVEDAAAEFVFSDEIPAVEEVPDEEEPVASDTASERDFLASDSLDISPQEDAPEAPVDLEPADTEAVSAFGDLDPDANTEMSDREFLLLDSEMDFGDVSLDEMEDTEPAPKPIFESKETGIDQSDDLIPATVTAAKVYESQGLTAKALEIYERVLQADPQNAEARERMEVLASSAPQQETSQPLTAAEKVATLNRWISNIDSFVKPK